jgi:hypothetical protein
MHAKNCSVLNASHFESFTPEIQFHLPLKCDLHLMSHQHAVLEHRRWVADAPAS